MPGLDAVGILELSSIGAGYLAQDAILKAAAVELLVARTICSGKFFIAVAGDVASVQAGIDAGAVACNGSIIERKVLSRIHPSVFPALSMAVDLAPEQAQALGVVETFSAASAIEAADIAAKAAAVTLFRIHVAMAIGGKGFVLMTGDVASVQAAVDAGSAAAGREGMLVSRGVIPAPRRELFRDYV